MVTILRNRRFGRIACATAIGLVALTGGPMVAPVQAAPRQDGAVVAPVVPATPAVIAANPDGARYAFVSLTNQLAVRSRTDASAVPTILPDTPSEPITALAWSRDGVYLAAGSDDRKIRIWNVLTGKRVKELKEPRAPKTPDGVPDPVSRITALAFGAAGTELVVTDSGFRYLVRYVGETPEDLKYQDAITTPYGLLSVASDTKGGWVAGDGGGRFHFYDGLLREIGVTGSKVAGAIRSLATNTDGSLLASGGDDAQIKTWPLVSAATAAAATDKFVVQNRYTTGGPLVGVTFRNDGQNIVATDTSARFAEWNYAAQAVAVTPVAPVKPVVPDVTPPVVAPPVTTPPVTAPPVATTKPTGPKPTGPKPAPTKPVTAKPTKPTTKPVKIAAVPPPTAPRLKPPTITELRKLLGHSEYVNTVAFSPDGKYLVSGSRDKTVRLWETQTGTQKALLGKHENFVSAVTFTPDGRKVASGGWDNRIFLWDWETGKKDEPAALQKHTSYVLSLDFSPDGLRLATGSNDKTARVWSLPGYATKATPTLANAVSIVAFSPDGRRIAGGCLDGSVYVWDAQTLSVEHKFPGAAGKPIFTLVFADNDTVISAGKGGNIRLLDVKNPRTPHTILSEGADVYALAYDPHRHLLASGSADKLIRVWYLSDIRGTKGTVTPTLRLTGHTDTVRSLAFSSDGSMLASGGWDYNILLWSVSGEAQTATANGTPAQ